MRSWAGLLDGDVLADADCVLPSRGHPSDRPTARRTGAKKREPNRVHLHLTSEGSDQETVAAKLVGLGAGCLEVGQVPEETHVALRDADSNELYVITPGNSFLVVAASLMKLRAGTRAVGISWGDALGWPLVCDREGPVEWWGFG